MNDITSTLLTFSPLTLFFSVILLSYLFEDLAIVSASVAAAQGVLPVNVALLAIFIGIASGDLGLYLLGLWARKWRALRGFILTKRSMKFIRKKLKSDPFRLIFLIRFVPGLRFIGFCLSGFFRVSLKKFLGAILMATGIWTALMFTLVYQLGEVDWIHKNLGWGIIPFMLILLVIFNRVVGDKLKEKARCTD